GGGLSAAGRRWVPTRQPDWLLPMKAVSAAFRHGCNAARRTAAPELHAQVPDSVWRKPWWVHSQDAGSGAAAVRYLARSVFRTAISDERIAAATDESVTFTYIDSQTQQPGKCEISAEEFMRRYLQHVLPPGQHRVRYFGWMHPGARLRRCLVETLLAAIILVCPTVLKLLPLPLRCTHCGAFALVRVGTIQRGSRPPPVCRPTTGPPVARCA
ncbi:MAG: transposase, partial [Candidatus Acidiferrales bacterium]